MAAALTAAAQQAATSAAEGTAKKDMVNTSQAAAQEPAKPAASSKPTVTLREPTKEEIKLLLDGMAAYVNDSHEGLTVVEHPDGSLSLDHQGRFQNVSVAKTNADGSIAIECASSLEQVRQFLERKKAALPALFSSGGAESSKKTKADTTKAAAPKPEAK